MIMLHSQPNLVYFCSSFLHMQGKKRKILLSAINLPGFGHADKVKLLGKFYLDYELVIVKIWEFLCSQLWDVMDCKKRLCYLTGYTQTVKLTYSFQWLIGASYNFHVNMIRKNSPKSVGQGEKFR